MEFPLIGHWTSQTHTAAGGTAFARLIPPFCGNPGGPPNLFDLSKNPKNFGLGVTHVTKVCYTTGGTAHAIAIMRPLNYTYVDSAAAINQAVINIKDDPGTYSTNYRYPNPNANAGTYQGKPAAVGNNAIAGGDYCAYQLADGTWIVDTVSSVSTLAITMTTAIPNVTGGGVLAGAPFYFFGVIGDKDPATGVVNPQTTIAASQTRDASWANSGYPVVSALHPGDPLIFYSPNTSNAGVLEFASGFYSSR